MNAEELLRHYQRIAVAPDAIARLHRFILDLAVRGKLVAQDPTDEKPFAELKSARQRLAKAATTTSRLRWNKSAQVSDEEVTTEVPSGWVPARVNDTGLYINGLPFKPSDWKQKGFPIIRIQNLTDPAKEFNFAEGVFPDEVLVRNGDLLVSWSATLEAFRLDRGLAVLNQHIFRVLPDEGLTSRDFLLLLLRNAVRGMAESEHAHGLVMTHINRGPFLDHVVLIPPLAEQRRIVAKVDELMALCDRLEAARAEREATRNRLTAASLARLNAPDPETFAADARFALDALPALTARPDQIKQLRQTIFSLAVRGNLSLQGAWQREPTKLGKVATLQSGYAFKSEWFSKSGVRLLRNANVGHGVLDWIEEVRLPESQVSEFERFRLCEGDIVLSLDRPFIVTGTKVARIRSQDLPALLLQRVGRFVLSHAMHPDYLFLWIKSPHFSEQIDPGRSNGVPHVSSKQVEAAVLFLPPLAEQRRIVAKVNALMALCDQLEASLDAAATTRRRLLEALLADALAPAVEHAMEAAE